MSDYAEESEGSRTGGILLAAALIFITGAFHAIIGLAAVGDKEFFKTNNLDHYYYNWNPEFWGWVNIIGGLALIVSAVFLFMRRDWAVYLAVALAGLNAIWTFFLVFFFPVWAIIVIALDVFVIWACLRDDVIDELD
jgi:hypothetical protein